VPGAPESQIHRQIGLLSVAFRMILYFCVLTCTLLKSTEPSLRCQDTCTPRRHSYSSLPHTHQPNILTPVKIFPAYLVVEAVLLNLFLVDIIIRFNSAGQVRLLQTLFPFENKNRGKKDLSQKCTHLVSEQFSPSPQTQLSTCFNLLFDVLNPCLPVLVRTLEPCYRLSLSFPPADLACLSTCTVTRRWVRYPKSSSTIQLRRIILRVRAGTQRSRHIDWPSYRRLFASVQ